MGRSMVPARLARWLRVSLTICGLGGAAAFATPAITITQPAPGATVGSPVQVTASATSAGSAITLLQVYVDGAKKYEVKAAQLSTTVSLASGAHKLTIVAYDAAGSAKASVNFSVGASPSGSSSPVPDGAITTANIDELAGWNSCDICAGPGGAGSTVAHSVAYAQADPSRDGSSIKFHIGDSTAVRYGTALWWKYAGASDSYSHFVYDVYFYLKNPSAAQALEFDVNQTRKADGVKYIFGTECDIRGTHTWRVYDNYNKKWTSTGITCAMPTAYQWHHLVWEFERTSTGPNFVALTLDGTKHYVNMQVQKRTGTGSSTLLNVAFQLDGNGVTSPYDAWLDSVTISRW